MPRMPTNAFVRTIYTLIHDPEVDEEAGTFTYSVDRADGESDAFVVRSREVAGATVYFVESEQGGDLQPDAFDPTDALERAMLVSATFLRVEHDASAPPPDSQTPEDSPADDA